MHGCSLFLEDTRELHCAAEDCVGLRTRPGIVRDLPAGRRVVSAGAALLNQIR